MAKPQLDSYSRALENFTHGFVKHVGTAAGFTIAFAFALAWILSGIWMQFSNHWETALVACFALVTFLMIFLMQRAQSKELLSIQIKLNDIISATEKADNRLINIEESSEETIHEMHESHRDIVKNT